ncbi:MAG: outer membrane beta-barrel protein [Bacteroidetes bacterium]|nr:outer membrane beta-barrel protein [Bacteroidota bacterium]
MKKLTLTFSLLLVAAATFAQSFYAARRERSLILTGGTGVSTYYGELANPGEYLKANLNLNVGLQYYFTNRIATRVEFNWFMLEGDDAKATPESGRKERGLSFQSSNLEISAVGMVNLFAHGDRFYRRPNFNVYGFIGVGLLYFNPKGKDPVTGEMVSLAPLKTEGVDYSTVTFAIPYGLGGRVKLTPQINLAAEIGWRKLFTDYLDDVSTTYPGASAFSDPAAARMSDKRTTAAQGTQGGIRGNPSNDDAYMLLNAKIEYYLPLDFGRGSYSKKRSSVKYKRSRRR